MLSLPGRKFKITEKQNKTKTDFDKEILMRNKFENTKAFFRSKKTRSYVQINK